MLEVARRLVGGVWRTTVADEPNDNGGSQPLTAYLRLTAADLKQPGGTAFEIVAAPGANKVLVPISAVGRYVGGTTPYGGGSEGDTDVRVYLGTPGQNFDVCVSEAQSFWGATTAVTLLFANHFPSQSALADPVPRALTVGLVPGDGALEDGDSPFDVWVTYFVMDLATS